MSWFVAVHGLAVLCVVHTLISNGKVYANIDAGLLDCANLHRSAAFIDCTITQLLMVKYYNLYIDLGFPFLCNYFNCFVMQAYTTFLNYLSFIRKADKDHNVSLRNI